jgi:hypothetical protein
MRRHHHILGFNFKMNREVIYGKKLDGFLLDMAINNLFNKVLQILEWLSVSDLTHGTTPFI